MKIVITGHTRGLGRIIYNKYGGVGLSKSTGFDISFDDISSYLTKDTIFINNAFTFNNPFAQTRILLQACECEFNKIINIGTNSLYNTLYRSAKTALQKASFDLYDKGYKVSLIKLGKIDVENQKHNNDPKLDCNFVLDLINLIITSNYMFKCIDVRPNIK